MTIPAFDQHSLLPPHLGHAADPAGRSPYTTTTHELVRRFGTSPERRAILHGLLDYRAGLRDELGLTTAIQWLDGSFVEDVEQAEGRGPRDLDLLTIAMFPPLRQLTVAQRNLLSPEIMKRRFRCDAYALDLSNVSSTEQLLSGVTYWFGLFSHRRDGRWKGLLAVGLDRDDDARARAQLEVAA